MDYILLSNGNPWKPPNIIGYCYSYWLLSTTWWYCLIAEDNTYIHTTKHRELEQVSN